MTREEIKERLLGVLELKDDEINTTLDDHYSIGELPEIRSDIEATFNIDVQELTIDTSVEEMLNGLYEHFGV